MRLKKIIVQNFRRFQNIEISLSETLTLLAGANNSGKTSLVQLLNRIFSETTTTHIGVEDLSLTSRSLITESLLSYLKTELQKPYEEKVSKIITNLLYDFFMADVQELPERLLSYQDTLKQRYITVKLEVDYQEKEYIGLFSDYLMNLESKNRSFYFIYERKINHRTFRELLDRNKDEISSLWKEYEQKLEKDNDNIKELSTCKSAFEVLLMNIYHQSLDDFYYYSDKEYKLIEKISTTSFKRLFHYHYLPANRELSDDSSAKAPSLINNIVDYLSHPVENHIQQDSGSHDNPNEIYEKWTKHILTLSAQLKKLFDEYPEIGNQINETIDIELSNISDELKRIGESEISQIIVRPELSDKEAEKIVKDYFKVFYNVAEETEIDILLHEDSQGLGVSNLLFITIAILGYRKQYKPGAVNLFIIEEPEAHLHPQMQQVLIDYLQEEFYSNKEQVQAFITTHSNKIVKTSILENIRVIRKIEPYHNMIVDMNSFLEKQKQEPNNSEDKDRDFLETLFNINFSNLVFADKVIFYEGDTERMYIEALLYRNLLGKRDEDYLGSLRKHYVAYAQVGGAYAHKYDELIKELNSNALIFTDLDYFEKADTKKECLNSTTTNNALIYYYKNNMPDASNECKIQSILSWQETHNKGDSHIYCKTQCSEDGYARTLEEALLYQYIRGYKVFCKSRIYEEISAKPDGLKNNKILLSTPFSYEFWDTIKEQGKQELLLPKNATCKHITLDSLLNDNFQENDALILLEYLNKCKDFIATEEHKNIFSELAQYNTADIDVFVKFSRSFWQNIKTQSKLIFPIPSRNKKEKEEGVEVNIRRVVKSIGRSGKTDFMYSIILNNLQEFMMPTYIKEGLMWLEKN